MLGADLKQNIVCCIEKLQEIGLRIVGLTSDQGSNFSSAISTLGVSSEKPYFTVNGCKVFTFNDPPHLWKSIRNCLLNHDIDSGTGLASWIHIKNLYDIDKSKCLRQCPKLTDDHVMPPKFGGKMKVKFAVQVFSHTIFAAMKSSIFFEELTPSAEPTAIFCERVNSIIDIMNSSHLNGKSPYKSALKVGSESFIEISNSIKWIKSWKVINDKGKTCNSKFKFIDGLLLTLTSIQELLLHLHREENFTFLLTRRLCQDPLEHFFSTIRQRGGFNANPTCIGFRQAFRQANLN